MATKRVGGRAKKLEPMSMQEFQDALKQARLEGIEQGYEAHERTTRIQNPRHPECQTCEVLYERDELKRELVVRRVTKTRGPGAG